MRAPVPLHVVADSSRALRFGCLAAVNDLFNSFFCIIIRAHTAILSFHLLLCSVC